MKKYLLAFLLSFYFAFANADENVGTYVNAFDGKTYNIDVRLKNNDIQYLYVYTPTSTGQTGYFCVKGKDLEKLYAALQFISNKFEEWKKTAEEQGITKMNKSFGTQMPSANFFWIGNQQWVAKSKLVDVFMVSDAKCLIVLGAKVSALQNKFIENTFNLIFSSKEQIDAFLSVIEREKMIKKATETQRKVDLFK